MKLVKEPHQPLPMLSVNAEAEEQRNALVLAAKEIQQVTDATENRQARDAVVAMRQHLKSVEAARTELSRPLREATSQLKALADDHNSPLTVEINRLQSLATEFARQEQERLDADNKARQELIAEARNGAEVEALLTDQATVNRAHGQRLMEVMKITVTDIVALAKARPELVRMEPNLSAINALCVPDMPNLPPGLVLSYETKVIFSTT